jgi:hypothetical protein
LGKSNIFPEIPLFALVPFWIFWDTPVVRADSVLGKDEELAVSLSKETLLPTPFGKNTGPARKKEKWSILCMVY